MKRILLILLCLAFWLPSNASMVRLPYVQDVQAGMVIGSGGGDSALYTAATEIWNFENDATAEKNSDHDLSGTVSYSSTSPPQGSYFLALNENALTLSDANADIFEPASGEDYSVSFWYYFNDGTEEHILKKNNAQDGIWLLSSWTASGYELKVRHDNNWSGTIVSTSASSDYFTADTWHHVVIVYDGDATTSNLTIYISAEGGTFGDISNGVVYDMGYSPGGNTENATFGNAAAGYSGGLDQFVWFSEKELNATEAEALYNGELE